MSGVLRPTLQWARAVKKNLCDFMNQEIILDTVLRMKKQHFLSCPLRPLCSSTGKVAFEANFYHPGFRNFIIENAVPNFGHSGFRNFISESEVPFVGKI